MVDCVERVGVVAEVVNFFVGVHDECLMIIHLSKSSDVENAFVSGVKL